MSDIIHEGSETPTGAESAQEQSGQQKQAALPGWYPEQDWTRWWNGREWTQYYEMDGHRFTSAQSLHDYTRGKAIAAYQAAIGVPPQVRPTRQAPLYVRGQQGHSVMAWTLISIITGGLGLLFVIYFSVSPNHYWHA